MSGRCEPPREPDLELRGQLIRSLGAFREMLPGSFVERKRACGRPNCHCADGKHLHSQYQISVLIEAKSSQHPGRVGGEGAGKNRDAPAL